MVGVKGRSGAQPRHITATRNAVISLSWEFLEKCMLDEKFPMAQKVRIAQAICVRSIPQEVELNTATYNQVLDELTNSDPTTIRSVISRLREGSCKG